jgi:hypothetical protein
MKWLPVNAKRPIIFSMGDGTHYRAAWYFLSWIFGVDAAECLSRISNFTLIVPSFFFFNFAWKIFGEFGRELIVESDST